MNRIQRMSGLLLILALLAACNIPSSTTPSPAATQISPTAFHTNVAPAYDKTSQPAVTEAYRLKLRLTTTSDWTRVIFENATLAITDQNIIQGADAPELTIVEMPEIAIGKKPLDQTKLVVEFEAYIPVTDEDAITISIGKGSLGFTQIELYNFNQDQPIKVQTLEYLGAVSGGSDPDKKFFEIPTKSLADNGPRTLPIHSYPKTVLAFYYPWYGLADGASREPRVWNEYHPVRTPAVGYYDSHDSATVEKQIDEAKSSGIDGFIVSWWGINDFTDRALRNVILPAAGRKSFAITIYYENYGQDRDQIANDFAYLINAYGPEPAFMKMDGHPVLFVYDSVATKFKREDWEFVFQSLADKGLQCFCIADGISSAFHLGDAQFSYLFDLFQGIHNYFPLGYSQEFLQQFYKSNSLKANAKGILFAGTASPGFDNSSWAPAFGKDRLTIGREDGQLYRQTWEAAVASAPAWMLITTFNEWPEGTEIEPSQEFGDQYLQITRELVDSWKK
ncbi:MAG: endo-1,3-alpha-glucanase family glycosylhydrolase [Anaerolineales bacterium]|nr:MAG: endo-1,3-alpha-glucanase family glycosylhydrolase [Anaerolineales bacterium]